MGKTKKKVCKNDVDAFDCARLAWRCACKALRKTFAASEAIAAASKDFVMVNLEDDEEPAGDEWKPDGGYIPRLIFQKSDGSIQPQIKNEQGNPKYGYFYSNEQHVLSGFENALKQLQ